MKAGRSIAAMLALGCSMVVSGASAETTGYPGTLCEVNFSNSGAFHDGVIARNQATSAATFVCSAVQQGGVITGARVGVRDTAPSGEIVCFARASGEFDSSGFVTASASSGVAFVGTTALILGSTSNYVVNGSKNVVCSMPARLLSDGSGVASYQITEG